MSKSEYKRDPFAEDHYCITVAAYLWRNSLGYRIQEHFKCFYSRITSRISHSGLSFVYDNLALLTELNMKLGDFVIVWLGLSLFL